ncbi:MAG: hypothetical protein HY951_09375 [Bacteroidia bacterium]|nr:hypothetical protein [Bacteroidia bacterium]
MKYLKLLFLSSLSVIMFSCNDSTPPVENILEDSTSTNEITELQKSTVKIPSPIELFSFIYEANAKYNKENLNSTDNRAKYVTNQKKAINLGIYASDLGYCTVFKQNKETFSYFSVTKKMADELGLTEGFDEKIVSRIDANMSNSDSLFQISNDSYSTAVRFLEQQGQGNLLPLMITGAWIESVNIAIKSVDKFNPDNEIVIRIADQGLLLENLLDMYKSLGENENEPELYNKLLDLQQSFDKLYDNTDEIITKKQFEEISSKIKAIRAELIG